MAELISTVLNAIPFVTSGLTLVAFIAACVTLAHLHSTKAKQDTLRGTNDEKKIAVLQLVLGRLGLSLDKLGKKEAFELAKGELERMKKQDLHRVIVTIIGMVLLTAIAILSIIYKNKREDIPSTKPIEISGPAIPEPEIPPNYYFQLDSIAGVFCESKNIPDNSISKFGISDLIEINLTQCSGTPIDGSRSYRINWPTKDAQPPATSSRPGYYQCIPSDLNEHAPEFVQKMENAFIRVSDRIPCKARISVHRFLNISYNDSQNKEHAANFLQSYNQENSFPFDIKPIEARPEFPKEKFDTLATGKNLDELLINTVTQFKIPNIPRPNQGN